MKSDCRKCRSVASGFNASDSTYCGRCWEKLFGANMRKCRICSKTGNKEEFHGKLHKRCKYLRDKRIAAGIQLTTITQKESI